MPELNAGGRTPDIWYETRGDDSNPPMLLLHGFTGTHSTWDALSARFTETSFLILPDLPGHGRSAATTARARMGIGPTADSLAEVARLAGRGRRAAVLGYSLGGRIALDLACRHKALPSCLILEGASPGIEQDDERKLRRAADEALADEIEKRGVEWFVDYWQDASLFATQKELPRPALRRIRRDRLSNTSKGLAMSLRAAGTGAMPPLWRDMKSLRVPVLLVVGRRDTKYAATAEAMRRRIPGSVVAEVDGAGHCPHLERPEEFAELVERFLEGSSVTVPAAGERGRAG
jgi:2-succinyl-6-hydroxy-2,4-cyclohexadiene-1-carboxylate synthase